MLIGILSRSLSLIKGTNNVPYLSVATSSELKFQILDSAWSISFRKPFMSLSFLTLTNVTNLFIKELINTCVWQGRKVGPSRGTPGRLGPSGPPWLLGTLGPPVPQDPMDPRDSQDLWTVRTPCTSRPQDSWDITSTVWNSESKHQETMKLKHKQRTFLNYIISKRKTACIFWGYFIYWVVNNGY